MRTAILYDGPSASGSAPDLLILETIEAVEAALVARGYEAVRVPVFPGGAWMERLVTERPDLAFNLCEGIDGVAEAEPGVIGVLELLGLRYTGASSWTTALCLRKHIVNAVLDRAGIPIPPFALARAGEEMPEVGYPAICKPSAEDASIGVEQRSVVRNREELKTRLAEMHTRWPDILVQRFVDGREMNVGVIADAALPIAEITFGRMPPEKWRIVSYLAKWAPGSDEDVGTSPVCPAELEPDMADRLRAMALKAWRVVGGSGYARVDLRVDAEGPWVLEVNSNPDIAPDAGLARMARAAGLDYSQLIWAVCDEAMRRPAVGVNAWAATERLSGMREGVTATGQPL